MRRAAAAPSASNVAKQNKPPTGPTQLTCTHAHTHAHLRRTEGGFSISRTHAHSIATSKRPCCCCCLSFHLALAHTHSRSHSPIFFLRCSSLSATHFHPAVLLQKLHPKLCVRPSSAIMRLAHLNYIAHTPRTEITPAVRLFAHGEIYSTPRTLYCKMHPTAGATHTHTRSPPVSLTHDRRRQTACS